MREEFAIVITALCFTKTSVPERIYHRSVINGKNRMNDKRDISYKTFVEQDPY